MTTVTFVADYEKFHRALQAASLQLEKFERASKIANTGLRRELNNMSRLVLPVLPLAILGAVVIASSPQLISRRELLGSYLWARKH